MRLAASAILLALIVLAQAAKEIGKGKTPETPAATDKEVKVCFKECGKCIVLMKQENNGNSKGGILFKTRESTDGKGTVFIPFKVTKENAGKNEGNPYMGGSMFKDMDVLNAYETSFDSGKEGTGDKIFGQCVKLTGYLVQQNENPDANTPKMNFEACIFPEGGPVRVAGEELTINACTIKYNVIMEKLDFVDYDKLTLIVKAKPEMIKGKDGGAPKAGRTLSGKPAAKECKNAGGTKCTKNKEFAIDDKLVAYLSTQVKAEKKNTDGSVTETKTEDITVESVEEGSGKDPGFKFVFNKPASHQSGDKWDLTYDPLISDITSSAVRFSINLLLMAFAALIVKLF